MPNSKIVFNTDACWGIEAGEEYEVFDSEDGSNYPFYIMPTGAGSMVWVDMETMTIDDEYKFTLVTWDAPYKTIKDKKSASKRIKGLLEEMKTIQEDVLSIEVDLLNSGVEVSIDFEEFKVTSNYRQLHKLV